MNILVPRWVAKNSKIIRVGAASLLTDRSSLHSGFEIFVQDSDNCSIFLGARFPLGFLFLPRALMCSLSPRLETLEALLISSLLSSTISSGPLGPAIPFRCLFVSLFSSTAVLQLPFSPWHDAWNVASATCLDDSKGCMWRTFPSQPPVLLLNSLLVSALVVYLEALCVKKHLII